MTKNYRKETEKAIEEVLHEMRNTEIKKCILQTEDELNDLITETIEVEEFDRKCNRKRRGSAYLIKNIVFKYDELLKNYLEAVKEAHL